jgi:hypothetical protein
MIDIKIYGCSKDMVLKDTVKKATVYFLYKLVPKKRNLKLRIVLIKDLLINEAVYGECYDNRKIDVWSDYLIRLDGTVDTPSLIKTLAHELVHLKQFYRKELRMYDQYNMWKQRKYPIEYSYEKMPWEVEATLLEEVLYCHFIKL